MSDQLIGLIQKAACEAFFPDQKPFLSLSSAAAGRIAEAAGLKIRDIEIAALSADILPQRYVRNFRSLSPADQVLLLNSAATVVGVGGLGGTVAELLARTGIGRLTLIDGDVFEESNLNRQRFSNLESIGRKKAEVAKSQITAINPAVEVVLHCCFMDSGNADTLLNETDIVVDCLDTIQSRFILASAARKKRLPLVYGAVGGHTGQVMTILPEDPGLKTIYGIPETDKIPDKGIEARMGTLPPVVYLVSSAQCAEVVKVLLNKPNVLSRRLLVMDPVDLLFDVLDL